MPIPKFGLDFEKEKMYKALIDKEDLERELPSMYTLIVERIKLGRLNEENKKRKELEKKNPELANKKFVKQPKPPSDWLKSRLGNFELSDVIKVLKNRLLS